MLSCLHVSTVLAENVIDQKYETAIAVNIILLMVSSELLTALLEYLDCPCEGEDMCPPCHP